MVRAAGLFLFFAGARLSHCTIGRRRKSYAACMVRYYGYMRCKDKHECILQRDRQSGHECANDGDGRKTEHGTRASRHHVRLIDIRRGVFERVVRCGQVVRWFK